MPQGPIPINKTPIQGSKSALNVTGGAAVLVSAVPGRIATIVVTSLMTGSITVNDANTAAGAAAGNLLYTSVATLKAGSIVKLNMPMANGIVVTPGSAGTVAVYFN